MDWIDRVDLVTIRLTMDEMIGSRDNPGDDFEDEEGLDG